MIRPITCITFLLACGSGLYLYQTKHRVHVVDAQIEQVVRQTDQTREQTRVLHAEWTLLDQPERLQQLAGQFLTLQPTTPAQFASAADLDSRLPAPLPPGAEQEAAPQPAEAAPLVAGAPAAAVVALSAPPLAAPPLAAPPLASPSRVAEHSAVHVPEHAGEPGRASLVAMRTLSPPIPAPRPQLAIVQPIRLAPAEIPRPAQPRIIPAALPRPMPVYQRPAYPSAPSAAFPPRYATGPAAPAYNGSMLGMAHAAAPPPPAPMWVNWNNR